MNLLANAVNTLAATLTGAAAYSGDYQRYGGGSARIRASLVVRDYEVQDEEGLVTQVRSYDWLFRVEDIKSFMPPIPGDRWNVRDYQLIGEQDEDLEEVPFEAMNIGTRPCFEPHDAQGIMVIVHTKKVANA